MIDGRAIHDYFMFCPFHEWNDNATAEEKRSECVRKPESKHRNMKFLRTVVVKEVTKLYIEFIRASIADLPKLLQKKGDRTKSRVSVLLCIFSKLFFRRNNI